MGRTTPGHPGSDDPWIVRCDLVGLSQRGSVNKRFSGEFDLDLGFSGPK